MKKLIVLALVLALSSVSTAALTWNVESLDLLIPLGGSVTIQLISDSTSTYTGGPAWVGFEYGGDVLEIVSITATPVAGGNPEIHDPAETGYPGWWTVSALDISQPFTIAAGPQWNVTIRRTGWTDAYVLHSDYYGSAGPTTSFPYRNLRRRLSWPSAACSSGGGKNRLFSGKTVF